MSTVKKVLICFLLALHCIEALPQSNMYRCFPQQQPSQSHYVACEMYPAVKTSDQGYIFSFNPYSPNIHSAFPVDYYLFKTDSTFIPQWRKSFYSRSVALPTGGVINHYSFTSYAVNGFQTTHIEKVTASGTIVWSVVLSGDVRINSGVQYGNKVRLVGGKLSTIGFYPLTYEVSNPYSIELDTSGNLISQALYTMNTGSMTVGYSAEFNTIKRNSQGEFFITGGGGTAWNYLALAKFDASFNLLWAESYSGSYMTINDFDILPGGSVYGTGYLGGAALFRFSSSGSLVAQKNFDTRYSISGLCRQTNGRYALTITRRNNTMDSLFICETDTNINFSWFNCLGKGISAGTPVLRHNALYVPLFTTNPFLLSVSVTGTNCSTSPSPYSLMTTPVQMTTASLYTISPGISVSTATISQVGTQTYIDSCKCGPGLMVAQNKKVCTGTTTSLSVTSVGNVSWYASATGTTVLGTGTVLVFSSLAPAVYTVYAQDAACPGQVRLPMTITVTSPPSLTLSPSSPTICIGNAVTIGASGAASYTWSNLASTSSIQVSPAATQSYSVLGSNGIGCSSTASLTVYVVANPTVSATASKTTVCVGDTIVLNASGAQSYQWNTGAIQSTFSMAPNASTFISVTGYSGACTGTTMLKIIVNHPPVISIYASDTVICAGQLVSLTAAGGTIYSWSNGLQGTVITVQPQLTTTYSVTATSSAGCKGMLGRVIRVNACTMVPERQEKQSLIYPNPSNGILRFVMDDSGPSQLEVYNAEGRLVLSKRVTELDEINIAHLPAGLYSVQIINPHKTISARIIKE